MTEFNPHDWEDVCFAMCMECPDEEEGFLDPPAEVVAKYIRLYPHFEADLIDFAATCRAERQLAEKYPAPEPTPEELKAAQKWGMRILNRVLGNARRRNRKDP